MWHLTGGMSGFIMMTSWNGNIFRVTGHLCGEFTGLRWIPRTKASDVMFSLICVWINGLVSNREAGDLRRYRAHYDVIVMMKSGQERDVQVLVANMCGNDISVNGRSIKHYLALVSSSTDTHFSCRTVFILIKINRDFVVVLKCVGLFDIISCHQAALWMVQSVCPPVCHTFFTMFSPWYRHKIFTIDRKDVHAKGQGQRSKVKPQR